MVTDVERVGTLLKACYNTKNLAAGICLHSQLSGSEHHGNVYLNTLLIKLYGKCGHIEQALDVFNQMPQRNILTWNNMISAYAKAGHLLEAQILFDRIPERNTESWSVVVVGYGANSCLDKAKFLYDKMPEKNLMASNAMLAAFAKNRDLYSAETLLNRMFEWDIFSCNTMLAAYCQAGSLTKANDVFLSMLEKDVVTWTTMVVGNAQAGHLEDAKRLFTQMPTYDTVVWNAMVAAYGQAGRLEDATYWFENIPDRNAASWNSMICAYTHNREHRKAIDLFYRMSVEPNRITFLAVIDACSSIPDLFHGREIHRRIAHVEEIEIENALISMYGNCGSIKWAEMVFSRMANPSTVSWTAMVSAFARTGDFVKAVECFHGMLVNGITPNEISYIGIISSCGHGGSLSQAKHLLLSMIQDFGIKSVVDHYVCMFDMLMRGGKLEEGMELMSIIRQW